MKTSLAHLPADKREQLETITACIVKRVKSCEMVILFGSYARGTYVDFDTRVEYGVPTTYRSDFDILILTTTELSVFRTKKLDQVLDKIKDSYGNAGIDITLQFINIGIANMNKYLSDRRYFYTDIKKEGIMLYDSKKFKLARRKKLRFDEIKQMAQEYFDEWFHRGSEFCEGAGFYYGRNEYRLASFELHQSCESFICALNLVHMLTTPKQHDLKKLVNLTKLYTSEVFFLFCKNSEEDKRLFRLLRDAYIQARYNPKFVVTKEDIDALRPLLDRMKNLTGNICRERIAWYESKGDAKESKLGEGTEFAK